MSFRFRNGLVVSVERLTTEFNQGISVSIGLPPSRTQSPDAASGKRRPASDSSSDVWERYRQHYTIALYERALARDPENHLLILDLARAYADAGRNADAENMLERVLALHPKSALVRAKVAPLYARLGCPRQALHHYRKVLEFDPLFRGESEIRDAIAALSDEGSYNSDEPESPANCSNSSRFESSRDA